jgi:hypothetical protein
MNKIYYNSKDAFNNISYTPYVALQRESDGWWQSVNNISLEGEIVCCGSDFNQIIDKQNNLLRNFSENFKTLEIKENDSSIFLADYVMIEDIQFEESDYAYILPYKINLKYFDKNSFSGAFYVTDPEDSFKFESDNEKLINISHTVSAVGLNANKTAIENACSWVYGRTGIGNTKPFFISMHNFAKPILTSVSEIIDRINAKCLVTEEYSFDQAHQGDGILRYTTNISSDPYQYTSVTINGYIDGGLNLTMGNLRNRYKNLDLWSLAFNNYQKTTGKSDLNNIVLDIYFTSGK